MIPSKYSFKLLSKAEVNKISLLLKTKINQSSKLKQDSLKVDEGEARDKKRTFLKLAGVVGLGAVASLLLPKKAEALVFGSAPTSNVVGSKDASNVRINPAKEDGNLASIKTNTNPLVVAGGGGYIRQDSTDTIAKESGGNLAAIKTNLDKFTFDTNNSLIAGLKDTNNTQINPAQDDSIILLRRIVKLMESQAVVDANMRQRVVIDAGSLTTAGTISTVSTLTTLNQLAGVDSRWQIIDWSRQAYNSGMRSNLSWI